MAKSPFLRAYRKKPYLLLLGIVLSIFIVETSIMILLGLFPEVDPFFGGVIDSITLVVILIIPLYFLIVKPLETEIDERRKSEEELRKSELKYKTVTEASPDCIKLFDTTGRILFINQGGLNEHRLKDFAQARQWDYLKSVLAEDRDKFLNALKEAAQGKLNTIEIRHTSEGSRREVCLETMAPVRDDRTGKITGIFGVSRDITHIIRLEKMKELLTHVIIHDLRNPLNALMLYLKKLEKSVGGAAPGTQRPRFRLAFSKCAEISNMISNILDIYSMEEERLRLNLEGTNLRELLQEDVALLNDLARNQSKEIIFSVPPDLPVFLSDRDILKRVVFNLLTNAIKYSPGGGKIELRAEYVQGKDILVSVCDQGAGIPEEHQEKIFEKAILTGPHKEQRGYGLGLNFCRMAVEAMGGRIWVKSAPGQGSTFYFTIPVVPAPRKSG